MDTRTGLSDVSKAVTGGAAAPLFGSAGGKQGTTAQGFRRSDEPLESNLQGSGTKGVDPKTGSGANIPSKFIGETVGGPKLADSNVGGQRLKTDESNVNDRPYA